MSSPELLKVCRARTYINTANFLYFRDNSHRTGLHSHGTTAKSLGDTQLQALAKNFDTGDKLVPSV